MDAILAGDIGGTNTRLALYARRNLREPHVVRVYASGSFESLQGILAEFLTEVRAAWPKLRIVRAGFGIAGPVDSSIVKLTNLPWVVDASRIASQLESPHVRFVNDFTAICHAIPHLRADDLEAVGGGAALAGHPIAVLGAGTGLGEGILVPHGRKFLVLPSEGGHTDFAPRDALETRLLAHLTEKFGRVSYERILSGPGLLNLYEFFRDSERMPEQPAVREQMQREAPAPVVSRHGLARSDALCECALDLFCSIYGAEAGNLALKVLARGGVYLAGGIAGRIVAKLREGGFRQGFERKGRYAAFLQGVPTFVIVHAQPGLMGAAHAAVMA